MSLVAGLFGRHVSMQRRFVTKENRASIQYDQIVLLDIATVLWTRHVVDTTHVELATALYSSQTLVYGKHP